MKLNISLWFEYFKRLNKNIKTLKTKYTEACNYVGYLREPYNIYLRDNYDM